MQIPAFEPYTNIYCRSKILRMALQNVPKVFIYGKVHLYLDRVTLSTVFIASGNNGVMRTCLDVPSSSSSAEMAFPMPVPPPVTIATLCLNKPGLKTLDAIALWIPYRREATPSLAKWAFLVAKTPSKRDSRDKYSKGNIEYIKI